MSAQSYADRPLARTVGSTIFISRWLQAPLYLGLIAAQGVYVWRFMQELWHLVKDAGALSENDVMLLVLGLVDVVMIANLLIMVIIGGYETFVSRINLKNHPDQPEWLSHVNANVLKVKLAMAIVGISSIHLLQTFINASQMSSDTMLSSSTGRRRPAPSASPPALAFLRRCGGILACLYSWSASHVVQCDCLTSWPSIATTA